MQPHAPIRVRVEILGIEDSMVFNMIPVDIMMLNHNALATHVTLSKVSLDVVELLRRLFFKNRGTVQTNDTDKRSRSGAEITQLDFLLNSLPVEKMSHT